MSTSDHHAYLLGGARLSESRMRATSSIYEINVWEGSGTPTVLDDDIADDNSRFVDDTADDDPIPPQVFGTTTNAISKAKRWQVQWTQLGETLS